MQKILGGKALSKNLRRCFLRAAGNIFNLSGSFIINNFSGNIQDIISIRQDWQNIGNDINRVINNGRK